MIGHQNVVERFRTCFNNNRLANTYLFVGREGVGKRKFALKLAQTLFCTNNTETFDPCGTCPACTQVRSATHPDLILVSKPEDKNFLPVDLFVGDREHRRRAGLCHDINLTPYSGDRKIAIIDDADFFNAESANSLLKTLEEPPHNSIMILIGTSEHRQLPTILSRCQVVRFGALNAEQIASILIDLDLQSHVQINELASLAGGSVSRAVELNDQELFDFRNRLLDQMATLDPADGEFAKAICDFVEGRSKDASVRRRCLNLLGEFSIQFVRECLHRILGSDAIGTSLDRDSVDCLIENCSSGRGSEMLSDLIDRTMLFQKQVDANMAMANIVPAWLNDVGAIARGQKQMAQASPMF